jgi:energy-converting hydrogenase Eha subunit F
MNIVFFFTFLFGIVIIIKKKKKIDIEIINETRGMNHVLWSVIWVTKFMIRIFVVWQSFEVMVRFLYRNPT